MKRAPASPRLWPVLILAALCVAAAPGRDPTDDVHHHSYWGGKLLDLEDFQVFQRLEGEPVTHQVQDAGAVWRIVNGRRLEGVRLLDGSLIRSFELRGPCRDLLIDDANVYAVLDEAVEIFPRERSYGAQQVLFPGRRVLGAAKIAGQLAVLLDDTTVQVVSAASGAGRRIMAPELERVLKRRGAQLVPAETAGLVCRLETLDVDFHLRCVDAMGTTHWEGGLRHTTVTEEGATRDLGLHRVGRSHFVFGSPRGARPRTVVFVSGNGERLLDLERLPGGLVEGPDGALVGLLAPEPGGGRLTLLGPDGAPRWSIEACEGRGAATSLLVDDLLEDDLLVIACWDPADSGGQLFAVKAATGERAWEAEVARLGRPRGEYETTIELRRNGPLVFLEGTESALEHVQVFELDGGARRYVDAHRKW